MKSLRAGRKFLTPEIRFSNPTPPIPPSRSRSVTLSSSQHQAVEEDEETTDSVGDGAETTEELSSW